jgi:hypothetical protein
MPSKGHPTNDRFLKNRSDRFVASGASLPTVNYKGFFGRGDLAVLGYSQKKIF